MSAFAPPRQPVISASSSTGLKSTSMKASFSISWIASLTVWLVPPAWIEIRAFIGLPLP